MQLPRPMLAVMEHTLSLLDRVHAGASTGNNRQRTGEAGERVAYFHLRRRGYTVVARRWRHAFLDGEIDLIAWERDTLCFIEVKTRDAATPFAAEFQVDDDKQEALHRMAAVYVNLLPWPRQQQPMVAQRFDVVSVYLSDGGAHDVRLLRNAFR
jgi:putative endonuclease